MNERVYTTRQLLRELGPEVRKEWRRTRRQRWTTRLRRLIRGPR